MKSKKQEFKNKTLIAKIKEHKKEILLGTCVVVLSIATLIIIQKQGVINLVNINKLSDNAKILKKSNSVSCVSSEIVTNVVESPICTEQVIDIVKQPVSLEPFNVASHTRKLPNGQSPSHSKIEFALKNGIKLQTGETIVDGYVKRCT